MSNRPVHSSDSGACLCARIAQLWCNPVSYTRFCRSAGHWVSGGRQHVWQYLYNVQASQLKSKQGVKYTFGAASVQPSKICAEWALIINILWAIFLSLFHTYFGLLLISAGKSSMITLVANSSGQIVLHQTEANPSASDQWFPNTNIWKTNWLISSSLIDNQHLHKKVVR